MRRRSHQPQPSSLGPSLGGSSVRWCNSAIRFCEVGHDQKQCRPAQRTDVAAHLGGGRGLQRTAQPRTHPERPVASPNVVVVNDARRRHRARGRRPPRVVLPHVINCGQGVALRTGIDFAVPRSIEAVVTFDAPMDGAFREQRSAVWCSRCWMAALMWRSARPLLGRTMAFPWGHRLVFERRSAVHAARVFAGSRHRCPASVPCRARRPGHPHHAQSHGPCLGNPRPGRTSPDFLRGAGNDSVHGSRWRRDKAPWNSLKIVGQLLLGE